MNTPNHSNPCELHRGRDCWNGDVR